MGDNGDDSNRVPIRIGCQLMGYGVIMLLIYVECSSVLEALRPRGRQGFAGLAACYPQCP